MSILNTMKSNSEEREEMEAEVLSRELMDRFANEAIEEIKSDIEREGRSEGRKSVEKKGLVAKVNLGGTTESRKREVERKMEVEQEDEEEFSLEVLQEFRRVSPKSPEEPHMLPYRQYGEAKKGEEADGLHQRMENNRSKSAYRPQQDSGRSSKIT